VHIVLEGGRPTGVAYVEFASPQDAALALTKDKQMLGPRYVELFPSSREEAASFAGGEQAGM
jgi:heterogeneous nuclear ribonucleoprotein F/H